MLGRPGRLDRRVAVYLGALVALLAVASAAAVLASVAHNRVIDERRELQSALDDIERFDEAALDEDTSIRTFISNGDEAALTGYDQGRLRTAAALDELARFAAGRGGTLASEVDLLRVAHADWDEYLTAQIARVRSGDGEAALAIARAGEGRARFDALRIAAGNVRATLDGAIDGRDDELETGARRAALVTLAGLLLGLSLAIVALVDIRRRGTVPLAQLADAVDDVAGGHLDRAIPVGGTAEIRSVAEGVDSMRHRLLAETDAAVRRSVLAAEEIERSRIAGELHDDAVQAVYAASLRLSTLAARTQDDPALAEPLREVAGSLSALQERLRSLMFLLAPPSLEQGGLAAALEDLGDELFAGTATDVAVHVVQEPGASRATDALTFRLVAEAARNAAKHADAPHVRLDVAVSASGVTGEVTDDGRGFADDAAARGHHGLVVARALAEAVGGWFDVSSRPGEGTAVRFWLPPPREQPGA